MGTPLLAVGPRMTCSPGGPRASRLFLVRATASRRAANTQSRKNRASELARLNALSWLCFRAGLGWPTHWSRESRPRSAGVVFVKGDSVLLGWQNYGGVSQLSTFAGKEERSDNGEPAVTAVRETFEELLHLVFEDERRAGDFSRDAVRSLKTNSVAVSSDQDGGRFLLYVLLVSDLPDDLPRQFSERRGKLLANGGHAEKDAIEWVPRRKWTKMMNSGRAYGRTAQMVNSALKIMDNAAKKFRPAEISTASAPWLCGSRRTW